MFRGYWIAAIALGLVLSSLSGQAQEQTQSEQRTASEQQTPSYLFPAPVLVDIVENQAAADARERREQEASQREIDDLVAQQGMNLATQAMNDATQKMAHFAFIQTWLIGIGTGLLFVTLWLTWQANKAARDAVAITQKIGEAQTRAYLQISLSNLNYVTSNENGDTGITLTGKITNHGQSPAKNIRIGGMVTSTFPSNPSSNAPGIEFFGISSYAAPGHVVENLNTTIPFKNFGINASMEVDLWFLVQAVFDDEFGIEQTTFVRGQFLDSTRKAIPVNRLREQCRRGEVMISSR